MCAMHTCHLINSFQLIKLIVNDTTLKLDKKHLVTREMLYIEYQ